jgi:hypothetical protein
MVRQIAAIDHWSKIVAVQERPFGAANRARGRRHRRQQLLSRQGL